MNKCTSDCFQIFIFKVLILLIFFLLSYDQELFFPSFSFNNVAT